MSYTATTWRWPDSTFGAQKNVPFSANQQYPDCGPQRIYTLENILYGLENVIAPAIDSLVSAATVVDTSNSQATTASFAPLTSAACVRVTLFLLSTAAANVEYTVNSGSSLFLEPGYSVVINATNADKIEIKQSGGEADTVYYIVTNTQ